MQEVVKVKGRKRLFVFGAILGLALGAVAMTAVLYRKPGERLVQKVFELTGLRTNNADRFAFGYTQDHYEEWSGVASPKHPNWEVRRGFDVELVAEGLDYPVNLVFVPNPGNEPDSPIFYVSELHGRIRYMGRDGQLRIYAEGLLNFPPVRGEAKSDETGLSGLALVPDSEDLIVTAAFRDEGSGLLQNRILRLRSEPGGKKVAKVETILALDEYTSPSNQIQQARVSPTDGKLYVSVGDAENPQLSLDLNRFGGKLLRMNIDGTSCSDNPFYDESVPEAPRSYVYAYGLRNVFDFDFMPANGRIFGADNGKNVDRFLEMVAGGCYGWNGDPESVRVNALYTWGPIKNVAPVGLTFLRKPVLGEGTSNRCYMACYGPAAAAGANQAKSILELVVDPKSGLLTRSPEPVIRYRGKKKATVLGLAEGPDGLYFTDFWGETDGADDAQGRIWKVVTSKDTLGIPAIADEKLAALPPAQRGAILFSRHCASCHTIDGVGGREGPELTHVRTNLDRRLNSSAYKASVDKLLASEASFQVEQRPRLRSVLEAKKADRIRTWLKNHIEEPRFDHPFAKMPSFAQTIDDKARADIIAFLMTRS